MLRNEVHLLNQLPANVFVAPSVKDRGMKYFVCGMYDGKL